MANLTGIFEWLLKKGIFEQLLKKGIFEQPLKTGIFEWLLKTGFTSTVPAISTLAFRLTIV